MSIDMEKLKTWETAFNAWMDSKYSSIDEMLDSYAEKNIGRTDGQFFRAFVCGYEYARNEKHGHQN